MDNEKDIELEEEVELPAEENDEFDYDDDGNIIIPELEEETGEDPGEDGVAPDVADESEELEDVPEEPEEESSEEPAEDKGKNSTDDELEALKERYGALESQVRDTLSKLGVGDDDIISGLVKIAAEAADKTPEEYAKEITENRKLEEAKKLLERMEFEKVKEADTADLKANFPELKDCEDIEKEPWFIKFATFRSKGLTAQEAYSAANPQGIRKSVAAAVKRQNLNDTKSHLRSNVQKGGRGNEFYMSREELRLAREALPGKSDDEIIKIYKNL